MNIGIVGARKYKDRQSVVDLVKSLSVDSIIVTSGCKGVCTWAKEEAEKKNMKVLVYTPDLQNIRARFEIPKRYYQRNRELIQACDMLHAFISQEDHSSEIMALLELVVNDASIGLVVKTQFQRNSPENISEIATARAKAEATGRYIELVHGIHRNIVFPAEAALSADIAIGHAVGATAALEAVLAGTRCILLNPYDVRGNNDLLYAKVDVVYHSIDSTLNAIEDFRAGNPKRANLGDWASIMDQFDPFRDGNAGHRMRNLLEDILGNERA